MPSVTNLTNCRGWKWWVVGVGKSRGNTKIIKKLNYSVFYSCQYVTSLDFGLGSRVTYGGFW